MVDIMMNFLLFINREGYNPMRDNLLCCKISPCSSLLINIYMHFMSFRNREALCCSCLLFTFRGS